MEVTRGPRILDQRRERVDAARPPAHRLDAGGIQRHDFVQPGHWRTRPEVTLRWRRRDQWVIDLMYSISAFASSGFTFWLVIGSL